jgi:hypothetical protein
VPRLKKDSSQLSSLVKAASINARTRRLAAWSLGLGIAGLLTAIFGVGVLFALAALVCGVIALTELRPWQPHDRHGWALTGITFALAAILAFPLLLATAIPQFITSQRAKEYAECYANLQLIADAKMRRAAADHATNGATVRLEDLGDSTVALRCPANGRYKVNPIGARPECSIAAHNFEPRRKL